MRYPRRLLTEDEEVLTFFRPHWRVLLRPLMWAMVLAAVAGVAWAALEAPFDLVVATGVVAVWLLLSGRDVLRWWFTTYVLTTERIIVRRGMIARSGSEIPLENVVNVLFSQGVVQRLLGYGSLVIESAGSQGQSRLTDIPDPQGMQSEIYHARELRALHFSGPGRGPTDQRDVVGRLERLAELRERGHLSDEEFEQYKRLILEGG
jgi:membrane protein YdbS with pleckstrin-like domain